MVKKMVTKLKSNDDVSNLNYFDRLNKLLFGLARLEQTVDDNTKETIYTAKVLKVIDSPVSFPKNIFDDTKIQPKYTFYARIIGEDSPDENLPDPCVLYDVKDPKKAEQSQTKAISMHKMYTTTDKNLTKPQPGSLVRVKLPNLSEGSGIGTYYGLLADDSLPPPVKSPKDSVEAKQSGLVKKIPIDEPKPSDTTTDQPCKDSEDWTGNSSKWSQEKKYRSLNPQMRTKVRQVIDALKSRGFRPKIFFAWRSLEVQRKIYNRGHSKVLFSFHTATTNGCPNSYAADIIDERFGWSNAAARAGFWEALGEEAARVGLYWGGNFKKFKDLAHVQLYPNSQLSAVARESNFNG